jgi:hypothetical protein
VEQRWKQPLGGDPDGAKTQDRQDQDAQEGQEKAQEEKVDFLPSWISETLEEHRLVFLALYYRPRDQLAQPNRRVYSPNLIAAPRHCLYHRLVSLRGICPPPAGT